jgi:hypothetical protein
MESFRDSYSISCQCTFTADTVPADWRCFIERMQTIGVWRSGPPMLETACGKTALYFYVFSQGKQTMNISIDTYNHLLIHRNFPGAV